VAVEPTGANRRASLEGAGTKDTVSTVPDAASTARLVIGGPQPSAFSTTADGP